MTVNIGAISLTQSFRIRVGMLSGPDACLGPKIQGDFVHRHRRSKYLA